MSSLSSLNKGDPGNKQISQQKLHFHRQEGVDHVTFSFWENSSEPSFFVVEKL